jgi:hypothetical protein
MTQVGLVLWLETGPADYCDWVFGIKAERLRSRLSENPDRALVVMLGSSRTDMGFEAGRLCAGGRAPQCLVFNFGLSGSGPVQELVCLRRLLAAGVHPERVFIEVLPAALLQCNGRPFEEYWLQGDRLQAGELRRLRQYASRPAKLLRQWWGARWLPCLQSRGEIRHRLGLDTVRPGTAGAPELVDSYGWQPQRVPITPAQRAGYADLVRAYTGRFPKDCALGARPTRALEDLLGLCKSQGIRAALVLMPEDRDFRALFPPPLTHCIESYLAGLRRKWRLPLIDARRWAATADFSDGHHLLPPGAAAFTDRFGRVALGPGS